MLAALALVLALASGCGGPTPSAPRPIVVDAGVETGLPDPAMAEVLVWLAQQRDATCACSDAACAEETDALGFDWSFAHRALLDAARPTPAQQDEAHAIIEATEACNQRWHHGGR